MPLPPGLSPEEVAELFYKYLMENNREAWLETLCAWHRQRADMRGSKADLYWTTGRRYVDQHGYTYRRYKPGLFERAKLLKQMAEAIASGRDPRRPQIKHSVPTKKIWYQRYTREGKKTGQPLPIVLIKDPDSGGEWRVDFATI